MNGHSFYTTPPPPPTPLPNTYIKIKIKRQKNSPSSCLVMLVIQHYFKTIDMSYCD